VDISILIICHHDRGYLQQAIDSAKAQDFAGTFDVVLQQSDRTMAQNTNAGAKRCKGEYIKWLHDDDFLMPDCLTGLWAARGADVICANARLLWYDGLIEIYKSRLPESLQDLVRDNSIHAGTLMYKRKVLLDNPLDESLLTGEEYELNLRLLKLGYSFAYVDSLVTNYRIHEQMKSFSGYGEVDPDTKLNRIELIELIRDKYRY